MKATITNLFQRLVRNKKPGYCCKDCVTALYSVLDGEASSQQQEYFMKHIQDCAPCFQQYEIDRSVKEMLRYKLAHKVVPPSLIHSIKQKIDKPE
jgi:mycothiol system anti-sigma-R factor